MHTKRLNAWPSIDTTQNKISSVFEASQELMVDHIFLSSVPVIPWVLLHRLGFG